MFQRAQARIQHASASFFSASMASHNVADFTCFKISLANCRYGRSGAGSSLGHTSADQADAVPGNFEKNGAQHPTVLAVNKYLIVTATVVFASPQKDHQLTTAATQEQTIPAFGHSKGTR
jgi:hypothetical protein